MSDTPHLRSVRRSLWAVDALFSASWTLWIPTHLLFLNWRFPESPTFAGTIFLAQTFVALVVEMPGGGFGDYLSGRDAFRFSCLFAILSHCLYVFLVSGMTHMVPIDTHHIAFLAAMLFGISFSFYSGSAGKWYRTTLELSGSEESGTATFAGFKFNQHIIAALAGVLSSVLFFRLSVLPDFTSPWYKIAVTPYTWSAVLALATWMYIEWRQDQITRSDTEMPSSELLASKQHKRFLGRAWMNEITDAQVQAFEVVFRMPTMLSLVALKGAHQLVVAVLGVYGPLAIWTYGLAEDWLLVIVGYLVVLRFARALGNRRTRPTHLAILNEAERRRAGPPPLVSRHLRLIAMVAGAGVLLMLGAAPFLMLDIWPSAPNIRTASVVLGLLLTAACSFVLGRAEPVFEGMTQTLAPQGLRAVLGSLRSFGEQLFTILALFPAHLVAAWFGRGAQYSFPHLIAFAGVSCVCVATLSVVGMHPARYRWRHRERSPQSVRRQPNA